MILFRIVSFAALFLAGVFAPLWFVAPSIVVYVFLFGGYEALVFAALIDAYFGAGLVWPYYTMTALAATIVAEWIRPSLAIFTHE